VGWFNSGRARPTFRGTGAPLVQFALVLHDLDRPEVVQVFGPYTGEDAADLALADLSGWPMLRGTWEIAPIRQYPASTAAVPEPLLPQAPYTPITPTYPAPQPIWPAGQWPNVTWYSTATAGAGHPSVQYFPQSTACAPAYPAATVWTTGLPSTSGEDEPPDTAVPARI
jgi:hypothetical protein